MTALENLYAAFKSVMSSCDKLTYPKNQLSYKEERTLSRGFGKDIVDLVERMMLCGGYPCSPQELAESLTIYAVRSVDYSVGYWGNKNPYGVKQLYTLLQRGWTTESMIEKAIEGWSIWATPAQLSAAIFGDCGEEALPYRESMKKSYKVHKVHK